jgi:CBS domain-containing protein
MPTVRDVLNRKGHNVYQIGPDATVLAALRIMAEHDIGALVVLDAGNLVGIITERDYAQKIVLKGRTSPGTAVREIMSTRVICVQPLQTVEECMAIMTAKTVRHLPVLENKKIIGLVSIGDMVKSVIADQKFIIEQLEHYIQGGR